MRAWLQTRSDALPDELASNLTLLTCELVNNSVLHGRAGEQDVIQVELRATETGLRAEVTDPGRGFAPTGRERAIDEPGGWGLVLVERLAASWGVEHNDRTRVWFELSAALRNRSRPLPGAACRSARGCSRRPAPARSGPPPRR